MPFIGQQPTTGAFLELDSLTASATANYTLQLNGANYYPESVNNLLVSINGVIQGSSTMSLNGAVLTVGATLSASDVIDFVRVFGNVGTISTPTDGSVTANKIGTGAVTNAKIADSTIDLTSKVSGVLPVANGGSGSASLVAFHAYSNATQAFNHNTITQINFGAEHYDLTGAYNVSNGRFTPAVAGIYMIGARIRFPTSTDTQFPVWFYKNGAEYHRFQCQNFGGDTGHISSTIQLDADDYVTVHAYHLTGSNETLAATNDTGFFGHLIGVV
jgi:hypothetical protein